VHILIAGWANTRFWLSHLIVVEDSSLGCSIGLLLQGMSATFRFTVPALFAVQAKEIQDFDVTAACALTSLCRGSFKGHGCCITHPTLSN
tara:strand:- start:106 stop:375 length:270 start_codon:yes stop_codon:yes gene_type:complete